MTEPDDKVRICVVCAGNICRSPIAEVILRRRLEEAGLADQVDVESAGVGGWHVGDDADPRAVAALRRRGYDASDHSARQFRSEWFTELDLVLVSDRDNFTDVNRLAPDDAARDKIQMLRVYDSDALDRGDLDLPDPYYGSQDDFDHVIGLVERAVDGLVNTIQFEAIAGESGEVDRA